MRDLANRWYGYKVSVPEELVELQEAFWQSDIDGRVSFEFEHDVCLRAPAEGMERYLHHLHEINFPNSPVYRFFIVSSPKILPHQPGEFPDPFGEDSSPGPLDHESSDHLRSDIRPRLGRMVSLIADDLYLPVLIACAQWMAGGPKPEFSEGHSLGRCVLSGEPSE